MIGGFRSILSVPMFVAIIMIDGSLSLALKITSSRVIDRRSKTYINIQLKFWQNTSEGQKRARRT